MQIFIANVLFFQENFAGTLADVFKISRLTFLAEENSARMPIRESIFLTSDRINGDVASKYIISTFIRQKHRRLSRAANISVPQNYRLNINWKTKFSLAIRSSASFVATSPYS